MLLAAGELSTALRPACVCLVGASMRVCCCRYRTGRTGSGHRHAGGAQHRQHRAHDRVHHPPAGHRHLRGAWSACITIDRSSVACLAAVGVCGSIAHLLAWSGWGALQTALILAGVRVQTASCACVSCADVRRDAAAEARRLCHLQWPVGAPVCGHDQLLQRHPRRGTHCRRLQ